MVGPKYPVFDYTTPRHWLGKAERELQRATTEPTSEGRKDAWINFAASISQTEEWFFDHAIEANPNWAVEGRTFGDFRRWVRNRVPEMQLMLDLSVAAKHPEPTTVQRFQTEYASATTSDGFAYKIQSSTGVGRIEDHARAVIGFWRDFDPLAGPY